MTLAIRTEALVKEFRPARGQVVRALDGIDLEVRTGEVFGFLGPNGAGKSTTLRILLDLLRPTAGRVEVLGQDPRRGGAPLRARVGYLPGELVVASRATARELLEQQARLRGGAGRDRIAELAARFGLDLDRPARTLSKGNKQKIGVVQAFAHRPELLILDEPTSGLDPLLQHEFLTLVDEARADGATVLMSSHVLSEVEAIAGRVAIIRRGRLVDLDEVATLRERAGQRVRVTFAGAPPLDALAALPDVDDVTSARRDGHLQASLVLHGPPGPLLRLLAEHEVLRWSAEDRELEDLFLDHYRVPAEELAQEAADGR